MEYMNIPHNNFAFIDAQNLSKSLARHGWKVDRLRFRIFLKERFGISRAILFMGFIPEHSKMYEQWRAVGFEIIFKETYRTNVGSLKGNCDAELVLETVSRMSEYDRAVIITGDGDFACLIRYLSQKNKLKTLIVPHKAEYSFLLRKAAGKAITFLSDSRSLIELADDKNKKDPSGTEPEGGLFVSTIINITR